MGLRRDLRVHRASSLDEALSLLTKFAESSAVFAGGTELLMVLKMGLSDAQHLIDVRKIPELGGVELTVDSALRIGGAVTHRDVERSTAVMNGWPSLAAMERTVGNIRVQGTGTLGGNLCFADPQSDLGTFLTAVGATVVCLGDGGSERRIALGDFFVGLYETALREREELLGWIEVPPVPTGSAVAHRKFSVGERPDVTCTAVLHSAEGLVTDASVVLGSMTATPVRVAEAAQLVGLPLTDVSASAASIAEAGVIAVRDRMLAGEGGRYKQALARQLLATVVAQAGSELIGRESE